jgi:DHA1 family multidrug resistance protein-like MFS transporter
MGQKEARGIQVLLLCVFTVMLGLGIIGPIIPIYAKSLGATYFEVGLLGSMWSLSRLIFTPFIGRLSDVRGRKKIIAAGLLTYTIVSVLYAAAWDYPSLLSFRFLHGLGSAMSIPIAMAYVAEVAPGGREGRYMGNMNLAMFAGMGLGPLIGGFLGDNLSLSSPFYVMGALSALSLILLLILLPKEDSRKEKRIRPSFSLIFKSSLIRAAFIYRAVMALGIGGTMSFMALFISGPEEDGGLALSISLAGLIMSLSQVSSALLQRPFGLVADRYDKFRLVVLGGMIGALGYSLLPLSRSLTSLIGFLLLTSLGNAIGMPALTALIAIEGRDIGIGTTMGVIEGAMSVGMILGPLIYGLIVDSMGLRSAFLTTGIICIFGTIAFYLLHRS